MDAVMLQAILDKEHRLMVDLRAEIPIGSVTVTIQQTDFIPATTQLTGFPLQDSSQVAAARRFWIETH